MAKSKELTQLKKVKAEFLLIGKAKVSDYTFNLDVESSKEDSDWVYNKMNLGVDCGEGAIYAEMMGGYGTDRENKITTHGKKKDEKTGNIQDDYKKKITVQWDDRLDEEILETVGENALITVGLEKKEDGKIEYKKFLTEYDAIEYIKENLENDTIITVKGNLKYQRYKDVVQCKKEIKSIILSKCEEKDFKSTFVQTVLLDQDSIGKIDKELGIIPIDTYIVDYAKEVDNVLVKRNIPYPKTFDFKIGEDIEKTKKVLKLFKVKNKKIVQMTVDGYFTKGSVDTVQTTEQDIPDDIQELIDLGLMDREEVVGKMAFANGSGNKQPEKMVIKSPHIKFIGEDVKVPTIDKDEDIYNEDDLSIALILEECKSNENLNSIDKEEKEETIDNLDAALDNESDEDTDEDDWLNDL